MDFKKGLLVSLLIACGLFSFENAKSYVNKLNLIELETIISALQSEDIEPATFATVPTTRD